MSVTCLEESWTHHFQLDTRQSFQILYFYNGCKNFRNVFWTHQTDISTRLVMHIHVLYNNHIVKFTKKTNKKHNKRI